MESVSVTMVLKSEDHTSILRDSHAVWCAADEQLIASSEVKLRSVWLLVEQAEVQEKYVFMFVV